MEVAVSVPLPRSTSQSSRGEMKMEPIAKLSSMARKRKKKEER
jgi:hypothetical protein